MRHSGKTLAIAAALAVVGALAGPSVEMPRRREPEPEIYASRTDRRLAAKRARKARKVNRG